MASLTYHTAQFEIHVDLQQLEGQKDGEDEGKDERRQLQSTCEGHARKADE